MHTFIPPYSRVCTGHPQSLLKFVNYYLGLGHLSSHLLTFTSEFTRLSHSSIASHLTVNAFRVLQKKSFCIPMKNFFVTASQLQIWYLVLRLFSGCIAMRCTGIHFYIFFLQVRSDFSEPSDNMLTRASFVLEINASSGLWVDVFIICAQSFDFFWMTAERLVLIYVQGASDSLVLAPYSKADLAVQGLKVHLKNNSCFSRKSNEEIS